MVQILRWDCSTRHLGVSGGMCSLRSDAGVSRPRGSATKADCWIAVRLNRGHAQVLSVT